jgi:hypothetical protein
MIFITIFQLGSYAILTIFLTGFYRFFAKILRPKKGHKMVEYTNYSNHFPT